MLRTGLPWRDLPTTFGPWQSVHTRWRRWCRDGLWAQLFRQIAGHAFDSDQLRAALAAHGLLACLPTRARRRTTYYFSPRLYAHRPTIENARARLKRFRRIGTRYDKLAATFLGFILLAASLDWLHSEV